MFIFICNHHSFTVMSTAPAATTFATSSVHREHGYWPLTFDAVRDCDLSYFNDKWSEDMVRDAMRAILLASELPQIKDKEINVWKYLSEYSPPSGRGFQFSAGDDDIVSQVQYQMETGHSGGSMGWTMRQIEFISKNGVPAHREVFLASRRQVREECNCH